MIRNEISALKKSPTKNLLPLTVKTSPEKFGVPPKAPINGVIISLTSASTIFPNAAPITTATARSTTFPRNIKSRNPFNIITFAKTSLKLSFWKATKGRLYQNLINLNTKPTLIIPNFPLFHCKKKGKITLPFFASLFRLLCNGNLSYLSLCSVLSDATIIFKRSDLISSKFDSVRLSCLSDRHMSI